MFVVAKVVRRCGCRLEMLFRRWRGDVVVVKVVVVKVVVEKVVVGKAVVVVEMRLFQNKESKRIILPQRSQPGYTNNSL